MEWIWLCVADDAFSGMRNCRSLADDEPVTTTRILRPAFALTCHGLAWPRPNLIPLPRRPDMLILSSRRCSRPLELLSIDVAGFWTRLRLHRMLESPCLMVTPPLKAADQALKMTQ